MAVILSLLKLILSAKEQSSAHAVLDTEWRKSLVQTLGTQVTNFCPMLMRMEANSVVGADLGTLLTAIAQRLVYENYPVRSLFNSSGGTSLNAGGVGAMPATDVFETEFQLSINNGRPFGYSANTINPYREVMLNLASHFT